MTNGWAANTREGLGGQARVANKHLTNPWLKWVIPFTSLTKCPCYFHPDLPAFHLPPPPLSLRLSFHQEKKHNLLNKAHNSTLDHHRNHTGTVKTYCINIKPCLLSYPPCLLSSKLRWAFSWSQSSQTQQKLFSGILRESLNSKLPTFILLLRLLSSRHVYGSQSDGPSNNFYLFIPFFLTTVKEIQQLIFYCGCVNRLSIMNLVLRSNKNPTATYECVV